MSVAVVIPAAGSGKRFGGDLPKQYIVLAGIPVLARTLMAFEQAACVQAIVVAAHPDYAAQVQNMAEQYGISKLCACVPGGTERQHSIVNALAVEAVRACDIVLVHDAVRPFVDEVLINAVVAAARTFGAAIPGLVPKDTIKEVDAANSIVCTHHRAMLRAVQTPQGFRRELLDTAYQRAGAEEFLGTDDASVVERAGHTVHVVDGREENIKITTPVDMKLAELLLAAGQPDF